MSPTVEKALSWQVELISFKSKLREAAKAFAKAESEQRPLVERRELLGQLYSCDVDLFSYVERCIASSQLLQLNEDSFWVADMADTCIDLLQYAIKQRARIKIFSGELGFSDKAFTPSTTFGSNMQRMVAVHCPDQVARLKEELVAAGLPTRGFDGKILMPRPRNPSDSTALSGNQKAGVVFGSVALLFFMLIVILSIIKYPVPQEGRFPLVIVLALSCALCSGFLGGETSTTGQIAIPFMDREPVKFSATGGIAVLIVVLLLGYVLYVREGANASTSSQSNATPLSEPTPAVIPFSVNAVGGETKDDNFIWNAPEATVITNVNIVEEPNSDGERSIAIQEQTARKFVAHYHVHSDKTTFDTKNALLNVKFTASLKRETTVK